VVRNLNNTAVHAVVRSLSSTAVHAVVRSLSNTAVHAVVRSLSNTAVHIFPVQDIYGQYEWVVWVHTQTYPLATKRSAYNEESSYVIHNHLDIANGEQIQGDCESLFKLDYPS
jgi:hypothetical protein